MRPKKINTIQSELFKNRLSDELNPKNELLQLSSLIPWESLEEEFATMYIDKGLGGQPPKPIRLMLGLLLLQHMHDLSDENVVRMWVENPYWQHFCGYDYLQWEMPINPSSLTRWRGRFGKERLEIILAMTVSVAVSSGTIRKKELSSVSVDTTVMPKNITHPTDSKLLERSRLRLVKLAKKHGIELRQNYNLVSKKLIRQIGGYLHAKQMQRAARSIKRLKTILGRVQRDISRKIAGNELLLVNFASEISKAKSLLARKKSDKNKLYSLHEEEVVCISKGKAHKRYEFGCKVSLSITNRGVGIVTGSEALAGNPYDGHTLAAALNLSERITGVSAKTAFVDKGYKGHKCESTQVFISGQKRGITASIRKKLNRRQAIEPHIGHMKNEGRLGLSRLKGFAGDQANAILVASAYNLKLILNYLRISFACFLYRYFSFAF
jgi:IS5 family transposase